MRATGAKNLDDFSKTAIYIPFNPGESAGDGSNVQSNDNGDWEMRVVAYKDAWKKCLSRMQDFVFRLHRSSGKEIVKELRTAYTKILPGLPHPEIPVISIINPALGSSLLANITEQAEEDYHCNVIQLYAGDFPNLVTGMRSIISSFVQKVEVPQLVKRKGGTALASYDIKLLGAWYEAWAQSIQRRPNLVIVLHDFEQLDPLIMQDIFDICSGQVPQLPIVFLLSMTHPSSNYLNTTYPRSTMSLLRVRTFTTLTGQHILNEVLLKTFFNLDFRPTVMIGPSTIKYLQEYFARYHASVDTIFTVIQIAYMKHFSTEPLAILAGPTPSADVMQQHGLVEFLKVAFSSQKGGDVVINGEDSPDTYLAAIDKARALFQKAMDKKRLSLSIILTVQALLQRQGHSGLSLSTRENKKTVVDVMTDVLECKKQEFVEKILQVICGLNADDLDDLLEGIYEFLTNTDNPGRYTKLRTEIVTMRGELDSVERDDLSDFAAKVADWIEEILKEGMEKLEDNALWEAWYTGLSPFPRELLNPSIRASLMAGLLRPFEFQDDFTEKVPNNHEARCIAELPDTSILFKRYLDSGKMINVYDWFESFKSVLDTQSELIRNRTTGGMSPKKGKGKAKAKSVAAEVARDEDKWNVEVQARFIRALHELDYLGFIKHAGRKADHVQRTVFDIDDPE